MELVGVRKRGWRRVNQAGRRWSQPAAMEQAGGSGEEVAGGADEAELEEGDGGHGEDAAEAAVAEGEAEGLGDGGDEVDVVPRAKARTEPVPRMNMAQMMGEAMTTERPMERAG